MTALRMPVEEIRSIFSLTAVLPKCYCAPATKAHYLLLPIWGHNLTEKLVKNESSNLDSAGDGAGRPTQPLHFLVSGGNCNGCGNCDRFHRSGHTKCGSSAARPGNQYERKRCHKWQWKLRFYVSPAGSYTLSASSPGFKVQAQKNIKATVDTTTRVDLILETGSSAETVTVTSDAALLQTDRADVSAQIDSKQVEDLPVGSQRNFQALESLIPGVSRPVYDHSPFFDAQNSQSFQVNGQSEEANNLQFEGVDDNERTGLLQVYIPPAAAIQTVDVEQATTRRSLVVLLVPLPTSS